MDTQLKDPYTITFHRTRDHSLKLRGGARREPTTPSGQRRIWQPPPPDDGQPSQKTHNVNTFTEQQLAANARIDAFIEQQLATNARFETFCDSTDQRLTALDGSIGNLQNGVAALLGHDNERRARESILYIAYDELNLARGRILQTRGWDTAPTFLAAIIAAEDNGLITESQADNVLVADIVIEARRSSDRRPVHAVFEVSHTITLDDMQRAKDRADTVAAATDTDAIAAVIGGIIQPPLLAQAEQMGVRVVIPAMFRQETTDENQPDQTC